eukprot:408023-Amphidinium_carterae.1
MSRRPESEPNNRRTSIFKNKAIKALSIGRHGPKSTTTNHVSFSTTLASVTVMPLPPSFILTIRNDVTVKL